MFKIKRNLFVTIGLLILMYSGLNSCTICSGGAQGFDVIGVNVITQKESYSIENTEYELLDIEEGESVDIQNFRLTLQPIPEEGYYISKNSNSIQKSSFSFFQKAHACSPADFPNQDIKNITITSNAELSNEYPANSSLNSFFNIIDRVYANTNDEYFSLNSQWVNTMEYKINDEIFSGTSHIFTIKYELTDGSIFEESSSMITFN